MVISLIGAVVCLGIATVTGALAGNLQAKPKAGDKKLVVTRIQYGPGGQIVHDVAFLGKWQMTGNDIQMLARIIREAAEVKSEKIGAYYLSNGGEKLAAELSSRIFPLKDTYHAMMEKRPADYDPDKDPQEVKEFFRAVREVMAYGGNLKLPDTVVKNE